ncbi:MAG: hypothetical protein ACJ761_03585 [Chloroflexota bacterium]
MPVPELGAQRASFRSRRLAVGLLALALALVGTAASDPLPTAAASKKVVIVVGPVGTSTASYIRSARSYASQARSYGANVIEIYSPYATWTRVKTALQGANLLIYLGHGNGWPSPYGPFQRYTKDGLGLNAVAGRGNSNTKYFGEYYLARDIRMATNAVVILNRLCYASGNSEWGAPNPTLTTAKKRVDNFGAGFLRTNARGVFAEGIKSASYILTGLFRTSRSMASILRMAPGWTGTYLTGFRSTRTATMSAIMDPSSPGRYYRSYIGRTTMTAADWR